MAGTIEDFLRARAAQEAALAGGQWRYQTPGNISTTFMQQQAIPRNLWMDYYKNAGAGASNQAIAGIDPQAWLNSYKGYSAPGSRQTNPPPIYPYYPNITVPNGVAGADASMLPDWLVGMYPQLANVPADQLDQALVMISSLGLPAGWKGGGAADNSLGWAQLAEQKRQFDTLTPEQQRQWQETFNAGRADTAWDQGYKRDTFDWQKSEADRAAQQWLSQFQASNAQQQVANQQWGQQFGEGRRQFDIGQGNWNLQYGENKRQADLAQGNTERAFGENQRQFDIGNRATEEQLRQARVAGNWTQAMQKAQMQWDKQRQAEQDKLAREQMNMAQWGRRFSPARAEM